MNKTSLKNYLLLHGVLLVYSFASVCSKLASAETGITLRFVLLYGAVLGLLGIYAIAWQQVIKRMPLSSAYASKAVTVIWGLVWGMLFFGEHLTAGKAIGCILIVSGVILFARSGEEASA